MLRVNEKLVLALPKGRILKEVMPIVSLAGIEPEEAFYDPDDRRLRFGTNLNEMGAIVSLIQLYANPVNKRFAVIEHFATQKSCILTHGSGFDIILPPQELVN